MTEQDYQLWDACAKRGADVRNVRWLRDMRSQFATDVREEARYNLENNAKALSTESRRLGLGGGDGTPETDTAVKEIQDLAKRVQRDKEALRGLSSLEVGYAEPPIQATHSDKSQTGGSPCPEGPAMPTSAPPSASVPSSQPSAHRSTRPRKATG